MKKIIIILLIILLISILFYWLYNQKKNNCLEQCRYDPPRETVSLLGGGDIWYIGSLLSGRKFETQDQCMDYCLSK